MVRTGEDISSCVTSVAEEEIVFQNILASPAFQRAPALSRLLTYLWEHRESSATEYSIGIDVFGKRPEFDPKLDATIRVYISRLRQKLKDWACSAAFISLSAGICSSGPRHSMPPTRRTSITPLPTFPNMTLNSDDSIRSLGGFSQVTGAANDSRQVRFALRLFF